MTMTSELKLEPTAEEVERVREAMRAAAPSLAGLPWDALSRVAILTMDRRASPAAWQQLKNGKWVECSEFVAKGWGDTYGPDVRPLYASPPAPAVVVPEGPWVAIDEVGFDNFATSIYETGDKGLLVARCNQNGSYPWQAAAIIRGLNANKLAAAPQPPATRSYEEGIEASARVAEGAIDTVAHDDRLESADLTAIRERDQKIATAIRSLADEPLHGE